MKNAILPNNRNIMDTNISYLSLRKALGIFGFSLPVLLWLMNGMALKSSISHFYYSSGNDLSGNLLILRKAGRSIILSRVPAGRQV